jgi:GNAT superfamily N-acetyltransferase
MDITIKPVQYDDFEAIHNLFPATFETDRKTQVKRLGDISYLRQDRFSKADAKNSFIANLQKRHILSVKAVNQQGEVQGSIGIAYQGFSENELPHFDPSIRGALPKDDEEPLGEPPTPETPGPEKQRANEMVQKMEDMENQNWKDMTPRLQVGKTIVITGFSVRPDVQRMGIGSALLKWANEHADVAGVPIWVHSSEAAFRAYEKAGFEVVDTLDVDLDAWAPSPPPEGGLWGHYIVRWMKRFPKEASKA